MKKAAALFGALFVLSVSTLAEATVYRIPLISIACHLDPPASFRRANGYDCRLLNAIRHSYVDMDDKTPEPDRTIILNRAHYRLSAQATDACGPSCRFFYGARGAQCLAVAQSAYFTGLGSFMGRERTREESEATALRDCRDNVGQPGAECRIVISTCPPMQPD